MPKTLHLTLTYHWWDEIAAGWKTACSARFAISKVYRTMYGAERRSHKVGGKIGKTDFIGGTKWR